MSVFIKKPIAVEAVKWKGFNNDEIKDFTGNNVKIEVIRESDADNGIPPSVNCSIETLEGVMKANVGDYIIKGVNGEFYPCKQDIFEKTYLHEDDMGNVSDGYHTFNELYKYRMLYNAAFFNELAKGDVKVCKIMVNIKDSIIPNPIMTMISLYPTSNIGMTNINPDVNIITNNVDISFIISRSIVSLIISPQL